MMRKSERPASPFDHPILKGGAGSGNHGHVGRPGERGGSAPTTGGGPNPEHLRALTQQLMAEARVADRHVTPLLQKVVADNGGEMLGLEHRIKTSEDRIAQKMGEKIVTENLTPEQAKGSIYDSLRFTAMFDAANYTAGVEQLLGKLRERGMTPVPGKDKNYWPPPPGIYHGINMVMQDESGFKFELQFHTPQSFATKSEIHGIYEMFRSPGTSKADRLHLWNLMNQKWSDVRVPSDVKRIGKPMAQEAV